MVSFCWVQVIVKGKEDMVAAACCVMEGINCCHIGFLPCCMTLHANPCKGILDQIINVYPFKTNDESWYVNEKTKKNKGLVVAAIILKLEEGKANVGKKRATTERDDESESQ